MALLDTFPRRASALGSLVFALAFAIQPVSAGEGIAPEAYAAQMMPESSSRPDTHAAAHVIERHIRAEITRRFTHRAETGDLDALIVLGHMYESARGVPQDFVRAHKWYKLAEAYGNRAATLLQNEVASKMTADQVAEAKRLALDWLVKRQPAQTHTAANDVAF